MPGMWNPLGEGLSYAEVIGGKLYRTNEGQLAFAADPKEFAQAFAAEVKKAVLEISADAERKTEEAAKKYAADAEKRLAELSGLRGGLLPRPLSDEQRKLFTDDDYLERGA
jgi:hypothetical protein